MYTSYPLTSHFYINFLISVLQRFLWDSWLPTLDYHYLPPPPKPGSYTLHPLLAPPWSLVSEYLAHVNYWDLSPWCLLPPCSNLSGFFPPMQDFLIPISPSITETRTYIPVWRCQKLMQLEDLLWKKEHKNINVKFKTELFRRPE